MAIVLLRSGKLILSRENPGNFNIFTVSALDEEGFSGISGDSKAINLVY